MVLGGFYHIQLVCVPSNFLVVCERYVVFLSGCKGNCFKSPFNFFIRKSFLHRVFREVVSENVVAIRLLFLLLRVPFQILGLDRVGFLSQYEDMVGVQLEMVHSVFVIELGLFLDRLVVDDLCVDLIH